MNAPTEQVCLSCGKTLKPGAAVWLAMNSYTSQFTDSQATDESWGVESQGWFPFGSDCAARVLKDPRVCQFKGAQ